MFIVTTYFHLGNNFHPVLFHSRRPSFISFLHNFGFVSAENRRLQDTDTQLLFSCFYHRVLKPSLPVWHHTPPALQDLCQVLGSSFSKALSRLDSKYLQSKIQLWETSSLKFTRHSPCGCKHAENKLCIVTVSHIPDSIFDKRYHQYQYDCISSSLLIKLLWSKSGSTLTKGAAD